MKDIIIRNRGGELLGSARPPEADPEWLRTHGQQMLDSIRGFGFDVPTTLRQLMTVATGQPLSSPPKWCDTGCIHADDVGDCSIVKRAGIWAGSGTPEAVELDRMLVVSQRWMNAHDWTLGQPVDGILFDCPCFSPKPDP